MVGAASNIIVIDWDPRNGSEETLVKLARQGKKFPDTVMAETVSGGRHLYYAYHPKVTISGAHKLGPGIDVKTDKSYVVLPPSFWTDTGTSYKWLVPPRGANLTPLPKWMIEDLALKLEPKRPLKRIDYGNMEGYRRQALADLDHQMHKIAGLTDGRHEAPFKAGAVLGAYVLHKLLTVSDVEDAIMSACSQNGACSKYSPNDLRRQIRNGLEKARGDALPPLARVHVRCSNNTRPG